MGISMNLWSLTLIPGEVYPVFVRADFQITNAALGEELASPTCRSVVKVTHTPVPESAFDSDSDSESDYDSELDEELDDEYGESADETDDAPKVNGVNGNHSIKDAGEEDAEDIEIEDDEDSEEDDSEFGPSEEPVTSVMCSLTAGKIEQATLNLIFVEGEIIHFEVTGENVVHLMGNYINQFPDEDSDSDSDYDSQEPDDLSDIYKSDEMEDLDEKVQQVLAPKPKSKITEIVETIVPKPKSIVPAVVKPAAIAAAIVPQTSQKRKAEAIESPAKPADGAAAAGEALSKSQKKKLAKKAKIDGGVESAPAVASEKKEVKKDDSKPLKKTLPSGLVIEDVKIGSGPVAKTGKRLGMRYIGKLENGKQFDASTSGKPFSFVLGKGEVISGWDQGLAGMAVGGERRLTIPSQMAYGTQKIPGIPKNSTLKFDVKLVSVA